MKKFCSVILAILLIGSYCLFAVASGETESDTNPQSSTHSTTISNDGDSQDVVSTEKTENDTKLGNYNVEIKSYRFASTFDGKPAIIITYSFTNNDDDSVAFYLALDDVAFQNGVGLNEAFLLESDANYSSDDQLKEIKKGATIDVEIAYELNDTTTDVEVEVKELISFSNKKVTKIFKIA